MRLKNIAFVALVAGIPLGIGACKNAAGPEDSLNEARALWAQTGPSNYTMTIQVSCECGSEQSGPVVISVRNGVVESRRYVSSGSLVDSRYEARFPSIDGLFELVEKGIRENWSPRDAQYDSDTGYPTRIEKPGIAQSEVYSVTVLKGY
jgi:hypothetical protein